ncbi:putative calcium-binding protein CML50 [Panicum miliaceum]|uniref:Calcium-binding protein CML50 n=1 Tax=Panicum miliaceum TaxID=4540 RepID=A0A3L6SW98_PANMI|nr:putative calcium-binding protein CML50 [Panicum miliaceum]
MSGVWSLAPPVAVAPPPSFLQSGEIASAPVAGYPPPGSGHPYGPGAGGAGGYGAPPPYGSSPAPSAPPYGDKPPKEGKTSSSSSAPPYYGAPPSSQPYGGGGGGYGAQQYGAPYGAPPPSSAPPYGAPPHASAPYGAPPPAYGGSPFASLVPSAFPPGTDPNVVACFQAADRDGSGMIDDKELQSALSGYNQSFSLRTVHLLMYLPIHQHQRPKDRCCLTVKGLTEKFKKDTAYSGSATFTYEAAFMLTVLPFLIA